MKISKKKIAIVAIVVLIAAFLSWRLWPHSFADVISADADSVTSLTCSASFSGLSDGGPLITNYTLESLTLNEGEFQGVIKILNDTSYRQDFRNLIPWPISSVGSDGRYDECSATITLVWGDVATENCSVSFLSDSILSVNNGTDDGFLIYHPTDRTALNKLANYIQLHGVLNGES